jgi:hypothetical protein
MGTLTSITQVIHILTAILMAWPFYALVAVNQRARLGPPVGDRVDTYMEGIIKNRTIPCFVFQGTALASGLGLMRLRGLGLGALATSPVLALKFLLLFGIAGLLIYVHVRLQPKIDALFAQMRDGAAPEGVARQIGVLRLRRKRMASVCLFVVLTIAMLGVQVWNPFPLPLTLALVLAIAVFSWRAYASVTPYGWV